MERDEAMLEENRHLLMGWIRDAKKSSEITRERPASEFPELIVTVPDAWESVLLAPLYDVHLGHARHDAERFARHMKWMQDTPNVLSWGGGDLIDNSSKLSVGSGVYEQVLTPQDQVVSSIVSLAGITHKMMFDVPGNHEDRTEIMGISVSSFMSMVLEIPHFNDYCFCTIKWRGNNFRLIAHHGSGAAQTAGAQRNAARKALAWARVFDLVWTGHLHNPLVDMIYQTDFDQTTGRIFERNGVVLISPSYLKYFGTYAAKKQYSPGSRGLAVAELREDGRIDVSVHANGRRL